MSSHSYDQPAEFPEGRSDEKFRRFMWRIIGLIVFIATACLVTDAIKHYL